MERVLRVCVQIVPFTCCVNNEQIVSEGSALMQARHLGARFNKDEERPRHRACHAPCAMRDAGRSLRRILSLCLYVSVTETVSLCLWRASRGIQCNATIGIAPVGRIVWAESALLLRHGVT